MPYRIAVLLLALCLTLPCAARAEVDPELLRFRDEMLAAQLKMEEFSERATREMEELRRQGDAAGSPTIDYELYQVYPYFQLGAHDIGLRFFTMISFINDVIEAQPKGNEEFLTICEYALADYSNNFYDFMGEFYESVEYFISVGSDFYHLKYANEFGNYIQNCRLLLYNILNTLPSITTRYYVKSAEADQILICSSNMNLIIDTLKDESMEYVFQRVYDKNQDDMPSLILTDTLMLRYTKTAASAMLTIAIKMNAAQSIHDFSLNFFDTYNDRTRGYISHIHTILSTHFENLEHIHLVDREISDLYNEKIDYYKTELSRCLAIMENY